MSAVFLATTNGAYTRQPHGYMIRSEEVVKPHINNARPNWSFPARQMKSHEPPSSTLSTELVLESAKVRELLDIWYRALSAKDMDAFAKCMSSTFIVVEHDTLFSGSELISLLKAGADQAAGQHQFKAELSDHKIVVRNDTAWCTHRNIETFTFPDMNSLEVEFLETVVFVKDDGHWLIDRYHATKLRETPIKAA